MPAQSNSGDSIQVHRFALLHHKCGTLYIKKVLKKICYDLNLNFQDYKSYANGDRQTVDLETLFTKIKLVLKHGFKINKNCVPMITFVNNSKYDALFSQVSNNYKGFHVVRDPRDIIISGYFSHLNSHPVNSPWGEKYLIKHRKWLENVPMNEGLFEEIKQGYDLNLMDKWYYNDPDILEIKFEALTQNPYKTFNKIFDHIKINIGKDHLASIIDEFSFKQLSKGRKRGNEDVNSHYRKGISGDWKNHFNQEHIDLFKEKWGDLLIKLGYETDITWSKE